MTVVDLRTHIGDELHATLRAALEAGPVAVDCTSGALILLRHAAVEAAARDRRLAGVGLALFDLMGIDDGPLRRWYGSLMFTNEGAHHDRLRRLVSRVFTQRSAEGLRARAAEWAEQAVAGVVATGGGDLAESFSLLPMRVMCELLGVPYDDVTALAAWGDP
jgi:cytochrome P450